MLRPKYILYKAASGAFCLRQNAQRAALRAAGQATSGNIFTFNKISSGRQQPHFALSARGHAASRQQARQRERLATKMIVSRCDKHLKLGSPIQVLTHAARGAREGLWLEQEIRGRAAAIFSCFAAARAATLCA